MWFLPGKEARRKIIQLSTSYMCSGPWFQHYRAEWSRWLTVDHKLQVDTVVTRLRQIDLIESLTEAFLREGIVGKLEISRFPAPGALALRLPYYWACQCPSIEPMIQLS